MKKKTPENMAKKSVKDLLAVLRVFNFHVLQGMGCYPGVCDRIAIYNGRFVAIETKAAGKNPSDKQKEFLDAVEKAGGLVIVARCPEDVIKALGVEDRFLDLR